MKTLRITSLIQIAHTTCWPTEPKIYNAVLNDWALSLSDRIAPKSNYQIIIIIIVMNENSFASGARGVCFIFQLTAASDGSIVTPEHEA